MQALDKGYVKSKNSNIMRSNLDKSSINAAIQSIYSAHIPDSSGKVSKEYNGYISSFGAAVITSGVLPAVIFFEDESANSQEDRTKVIKAIKSFLTITTPTLTTYLRNMTDTQLLEKEEEVLEAAQAIKLALRTFEKK